jgi:hypothetical protein
MQGHLETHEAGDRRVVARRVRVLIAPPETREVAILLGAVADGPGASSLDAAALIGGPAGPGDLVSPEQKVLRGLLATPRSRHVTWRRLGGPRARGRQRRRGDWIAGGLLRRPVAGEAPQDESSQEEAHAPNL